MTEAPHLSVVVASLEGPRALEDCLAALYGSAGDDVEIIVADCSAREAIESFRARYPRAVFLEFPAATPLAALLGAGAARSCGAIVAVTDTSCAVADDWSAAVRRAHAADESPVIGGAVEMTPGGALTSWAAYFCDYAAFMPPLAPGATPVVPGNNFSVKRAALARQTAYAAPEWHKTLWCRALAAEGVTLRAAPSIVVRWRKHYAVREFLAGRFRDGRRFAARRFAGAGRGRRALHVAGTPLLPFVFFLRIARAAWPKRRFRGKFCAALPLIALAVTVWSAGEAAGLIAE